jgi:hypothetical protein
MLHREQCKRLWTGMGSIVIAAYQHKTVAVRNRTSPRQGARADAKRLQINSARRRPLPGCTKGSDEEGALKTIVDLIEAKEARQWPLGKGPNMPGGKG